MLQNVGERCFPANILCVHVLRYSERGLCKKSLGGMDDTTGKEPHP